MTEIERVLSTGILPEDFCKPETIYDFYVDEQRKKVWALELDLLLEFDRVCKKYNLKYYLIGGSLLGAVRHHGFIPWDDDIDIAMPREDYTVLFNLNNEFKHPYFLQTCYTDEGYFFAHARLRNSNTSAIQRPFCYCHYNMGIFLDILPLDKFEYSDEGRMVFRNLEELIVQNSTYMKLENQYPNEKDEKRIKNYVFRNPFEVFEEIQELGQSFKNRNSTFYCLSCAVVYGFERSLFNIEDFHDVIYVKFEGFDFPIPSGYDRILKRAFNNYMEFPKEISRGSWHGAIWFDTEKSYVEVKKTAEYTRWAQNRY